MHNRSEDHQVWSQHAVNCSSHIHGYICYNLDEHSSAGLVLHVFVAMEGQTGPKLLWLILPG